MSLGLILWVKDLKGVFNQIKGELLDLSQLQPKYLPVCSKALKLTGYCKGQDFQFSRSPLFSLNLSKKSQFYQKKCSELGQGPGEKALVIQIAFVAGRTNGFANG